MSLLQVVKALQFEIHYITVTISSNAHFDVWENIFGIKKQS